MSFSIIWIATSVADLALATDSRSNWFRDAPSVRPPTRDRRLADCGIAGLKMTLDNLRLPKAGVKHGCEAVDAPDFERYDDEFDART